MRDIVEGLGKDWDNGNSSDAAGTRRALKRLVEQGVVAPPARVGGENTYALATWPEL